MLISQDAQSVPSGRQGSRRVSLAELRKQLAEPTVTHSVHRQRLLELAGRLERVRALGDEYARIGLSRCARAAIKGKRA